MSDLKITLVALGAVIIFGVLLYNWWQERKFRLDMASSFIEPKNDALINDFEINPDAFEESELTHTLHPHLHPQPDSLAQPDFNELVFDEGVNKTPAQNTQTANLTGKLSTQASNTTYTTLEQELTAKTELESYDETAYEGWTDDEALIEPKPSFIEPSFLDEELVSVTSNPIPDLANVEKALEINAVQPNQVSLPSAVDTKIDLIAMLYLEKDLASVKLNYGLNDFIDLVIEFDKPVHLYGLNTDDTWDLINPDSALNKRYSQLACSLQLVDRSGAISRATLNRFQHAVELLGLELGSQVEWLSEDEPLSFAQQLDQFCIDADKIIGFHLVQGESGAFHGTKLRGLAEASGFSLSADGAFHYNESHHVINGSVADNVLLFSIIHTNNQPFTAETLRNIVIKGITFQMDIPRVKNCVVVFNQMVAIAQKMQQGLTAQLVDDLQRPLTELQISKICQQLEHIHTKMLTYGIAPGSSTALRLFS